MSTYRAFVSKHIRSAPGARQQDKMRAVAAMWRKHKGKGLYAGRGLPPKEQMVKEINEGRYTTYGSKAKGKGLYAGRGVRTGRAKAWTLDTVGRGFWGDLWNGIKGKVVELAPELLGNLSKAATGALIKRLGGAILKSREHGPAHHRKPRARKGGKVTAHDKAVDRENLSHRWAC
jgi:hypothetical protein